MGDDAVFAAQQRRVTEQLGAAMLAAVVAILAVVTSAAVIAVSAPFGAFAAFAGKFRREVGNNDFLGGFFRQLNDCRFCTDAEKTFCSVLNNIYCDLVD